MKINNKKSPSGSFYYLLYKGDNMKEEIVIQGDDNNLLNYDNISYKLSTNIIGNKIIHFESIDSTNDYAKKIALKEMDGTVIISEEQTKGRGRLKRKWHSKSMEGIWMSILLKPDIMPQKSSFITLIAGASVVKALNKLGIKNPYQE